MQTEVFCVENHQIVRKIVGDHDPLAVTRYGRIAGIQPGADFGDDGQIVDVKLCYPAVARCKVDETPVGGKFWSAVQCVTARKTVQALEFVAVKDRHVVIAGFDHDEKIERVGALERF